MDKMDCSLHIKRFSTSTFRSFTPMPCHLVRIFVEFSKFHPDSWIFEVSPRYRAIPYGFLLNFEVLTQCLATNRQKWFFQREFFNLVTSNRLFRPRWVFYEDMEFQYVSCESLYYSNARISIPKSYLCRFLHFSQSASYEDTKSTVHFTICSMTSSFRFFWLPPTHPFSIP